MLKRERGRERRETENGGMENAAKDKRERKSRKSRSETRRLKQEKGNVSIREKHAGTDEF